MGATGPRKPSGIASPSSPARHREAIAERTNKTTPSASKRKCRKARACGSSARFGPPATTTPRASSDTPPSSWSARSAMSKSSPAPSRERLKPRRRQRRPSAARRRQQVMWRRRSEAAKQRRPRRRAGAPNRPGTACFGIGRRSAPNSQSGADLTCLARDDARRGFALCRHYLTRRVPGYVTSEQIGCSVVASRFRVDNFGLNAMVGAMVIATHLATHDCWRFSRPA